MTEGSLFARGEAYFERSVRVKKELEVVGGTTIRMGLQVKALPLPRVFLTVYVVAKL